MQWAKELDDEAWLDALNGGDPRAPKLPPELIQRSYGDDAGEHALRDAATFWALTKDELTNNGQPLTDATRILDIGCGWGGMHRWMSRDLAPGQAVGIDADASAIKLCAEAMPDGDFRQVPWGDAFPGGPYDLAVLFSLFWHLNEWQARALLKRARKALKPGGILAVATQRPILIEEWAKRQTDPVFGPHLERCGFERTEWWTRATEGTYLFVPMGNDDPNAWSNAYGEAIAPKGWWATVEGFKLLTWVKRDGFQRAFEALQAT